MVHTVTTYSIPVPLNTGSTVNIAIITYTPIAPLSYMHPLNL